MVAILELLGPVLLIIILGYFFGPFLVVRAEERVVLERLGRFVRVLEPGLHCFWPLLYRPRRVKWSRLVSDSTRQSKQGNVTFQHTVLNDYRIPLVQQEHCVTPLEHQSSDGANVVITIVFYSKIDNAEKACYGCEDPYTAMTHDMKQSLKRVIQRMDSLKMTEQSLRKALNQYVRDQLETRWRDELGTRFCSVQVIALEVDEPDDERPRELHNSDFAHQQLHIQNAINLHPLKRKLRVLEREDECIEAQHKARLGTMTWSSDLVTL